MKGVVFLGDRKLEIQRFDDPVPGPGEVVLEIKASGMCGSDLKFYRASARDGGASALGLGGDGGPVIAGHEPCGVVAEVGPGVRGWTVGDRVVGGGGAAPPGVDNNVRTDPRYNFRTMGYMGGPLRAQFLQPG